MKAGEGKVSEDLFADATEGSTAKNRKGLTFDDTCLHLRNTIMNTYRNDSVYRNDKIKIG